ncbi:protein O-mannosyl-transferase family [Arcticibacter sp. MXS-1]|uniref:protein O-mannosyl-transferase family n=1 Tax=Arcticibacter sp. MXS-1 TaxID=3341726 RepID=UPI0035A8F7AA
MNTFRNLNNLFGWLCFLAAFVVYMLTLQPSVSFWDCGEFISTAYHLQVGHQPGSPLPTRQQTYFIDCSLPS